MWTPPPSHLMTPCLCLQACDPTCVATPASSRKLLGMALNPWMSLTHTMHDRWQSLVGQQGQGRRRLADRPCCTSSVQVTANMLPSVVQLHCTICPVKVKRDREPCRTLGKTNGYVLWRLHHMVCLNMSGIASVLGAAYRVIALHADAMVY